MPWTRIQSSLLSPSMWMGDDCQWPSTATTSRSPRNNHWYVTTADMCRELMSGDLVINTLSSDDLVLIAHAEWLPGVWLRHSVLPFHLALFSTSHQKSNTCSSNFVPTLSCVRMRMRIVDSSSYLTNNINCTKPFDPRTCKTSNRPFRNWHLVILISDNEWCICYYKPSLIARVNEVVHNFSGIKSPGLARSSHVWEWEWG